MTADRSNNRSTTGTVCHYHGPCPGEEVRPYGPGGALVCFPCAMATPERRAQTESAYAVTLEAAGTLSDIGVVVLGGDRGPEPLMGDDVGR